MSALLALVGGYLDAYTYLFRGNVFANGQTGNLVLLGIRAAARDWGGVFYYCLPILAFLCGVLLSEAIRTRFADDRAIKWRHVILLVEIVVLCGVLVTPQGAPDRFVNIGVSFVCALQTQSFRSLRGKPYISVMCTGNLRSAAEELSFYRKQKEKRHLRNALDYLLITACFILGALLGAVLTDATGGLGLLLVIFLLAAVLMILFLRKQVVALCERKGYRWLSF